MTSSISSIYVTGKAPKSLKTVKLVFLGFGVPGGTSRNGMVGSYCAVIDPPPLGFVNVMNFENAFDSTSLFSYAVPKNTFRYHKKHLNMA